MGMHASTLRMLGAQAGNTSQLPTNRTYLCDNQDSACLLLGIWYLEQCRMYVRIKLVSKW